MTPEKIPKKYHIHQDGLVEVEGQRFDGFLLIKTHDPGAGLSVLMTYALNGVRNAISRNLLPVINFEGSVNRYFYDPQVGENIWEYYWEPVMGLSTNELDELVVKGIVSCNQIASINLKETAYWHQIDPDRIGTFWNEEEVDDTTSWMNEKRALGRQYVEQYIKVKSVIVSKADGFRHEHFNSPFIFGVHIRGTDWIYAQPMESNQYFQEIDKLIAENGISEFQVFLATDQEQFVNQFKEAYGDRLVTYDCLRSSNEIAPFAKSTNDPFKKGEDVLIDILLLANCNHVLKCAASVGEYALWFNPNIPFTDFSNQSKKLPESWKDKTAFEKLFVEKESTLKNKVLRFFRMSRKYVEWHILRKDPRARTNPFLFVVYLIKYLKNSLVSLFKPPLKK